MELIQLFSSAFRSSLPFSNTPILNRGMMSKGGGSRIVAIEPKCYNIVRTYTSSHVENERSSQHLTLSGASACMAVFTMYMNEK